MRKVVKKLEMGVDVPLVIDTTELDVLEVALKTAPGRCLINSTHLESGRDKADKIFKLAKEHNAAVIVLTIDENGMAKTREKKLEVAKRIYDIAVNDHGLKPQDLVYDTLTFTLATGDQEFANSAIETIEGIRLIKQNLPGVMTSLGVSNLSFGLAPQARPVLNSVMLYHCMQAGLDMAIINPAHVTAYPDIPQEEKELAEDLIFNRRPDALQRYIEYYREGHAAPTEAAAADPTEGMTPEQRLHWHILHRHKDGVEADIDSLILIRCRWRELPDDGTGQKITSAVHTLNNVLLPAMKEVGDKFGAGELILPFVLQSAEVMKKTVAHLENYLEKVEGVTKGTVVIATVYGDVHDIGKNLVKTILANNGYTVIDLGKQVPAETIITKAVEVNATAIGLSALLVSTSKQMPLIINELHRRGHQIPCAGRRRGHQPSLWPPHPVHRGWQISTSQASSTARMPSKAWRRWISSSIPRNARNCWHRIRKEARYGNGPRLPGAGTSQNDGDALDRSSLHRSIIPLKWGQRVVRDMPLEMVLQASQHQRTLPPLVGRKELPWP